MILEPKPNRIEKAIILLSELLNPHAQSEQIVEMTPREMTVKSSERSAELPITVEPTKAEALNAATTIEGSRRSEECRAEAVYVATKRETGK